MANIEMNATPAIETGLCPQAPLGTPKKKARRAPRAKKAAAPVMASAPTIVEAPKLVKISNGKGARKIEQTPAERERSEAAVKAFEARKVAAQIERQAVEARIAKRKAAQKAAAERLARIGSWPSACTLGAQIMLKQQTHVVSLGGQRMVADVTLPMGALAARSVEGAVRFLAVFEPLTDEQMKIRAANAQEEKKNAEQRSRTRAKFGR